LLPKEELQRIVTSQTSLSPSLDVEENDPDLLVDEPPPFDVAGSDASDMDDVL
jgi:hypothetical protein